MRVRTDPVILLLGIYFILLKKNFFKEGATQSGPYGYLTSNLGVISTILLTNRANWPPLGYLF